MNVLLTARNPFVVTSPSVSWRGIIVYEYPFRTGYFHMLNVLLAIAFGAWGYLFCWAVDWLINRGDGKSKITPYNQLMWTTKTGERIMIADMSDLHLFNVIFYLHRRYGQMWGLSEGRGPWMIWPIYHALIHEADRRHLGWMQYPMPPIDAVSSPYDRGSVGDIYPNNIPEFDKLTLLQ
jgi:hypothetical protein